MKSLIKLSLTTLAISVLAACSGGGSGGGDSAPVKEPIKIKETKVTPAVGYSGVWASGSSQPKQITTVGNATGIGNLRILEIDGKKVDLTNTKASGISNLSVSSSATVTYGRYTDPSKLDDDKDPISYVFVYGQTTPVAEIPTTGTFNYKGSATYGSGTLKGFINDATANLTVDFQAKTVKGSITEEKNKINITLPEAKITDNRFENTQGDAFVKGEFFGKNASHIGGVFGNNAQNAEHNGYLGAFSASQQPQPQAPAQ